MTRKKRKYHIGKSGNKSRKMPEMSRDMSEEIEGMGEDKPVYHDIDRDRIEESPMKEDEDSY